MYRHFLLTVMHLGNDPRVVMESTKYSGTHILILEKGNISLSLEREKRQRTRHKADGTTSCGMQEDVTYLVYLGKCMFR